MEKKKQEDSKKDKQPVQAAKAQPPPPQDFNDSLDDLLDGFDMDGSEDELLGDIPGYGAPAAYPVAPTAVSQQV